MDSARGAPENPFDEGLSYSGRPPATAVVIFGASGDLTHRKLIPGLYNLSYNRLLPVDFTVIGAARTRMSDQEFRDGLKAAVKEHTRMPFSDSHWTQFAGRIFYQPLDVTKAEDFGGLRARLASLCQEPANYLYYLAASSTLFGIIASNLKNAGLVEDLKSGRRTSLVIEKPFGEDTASAKDLNRTLRQSFTEEQIFRIDHYLGKETVQNILVFRFANGIFEPLWNHKYIEHIQISVCESIGVERRAGYFDKTGILRDIVQNHLLQILSLLCIEPPLSLHDANSIRDEKVKVLRSLKRIGEAQVFSDTVRGQYGRGFIDGKEVPSYLEEEGVSPDSGTETYVAMRMEIDNWRWFGVPIFVRAGKRLPKRITDITVFFRRAPNSLFVGDQTIDLEQNVLNIQVQPNEGVSLKICSKPPGPVLQVRPVVMDFAYGEYFGGQSPEAYERLLLDAMKGDSTLFIRNDEIEEAWRYLEPVLEAWGSDSAPPLETYESGSWGPAASAKITSPYGLRWRRL